MNKTKNSNRAIILFIRNEKKRNKKLFSSLRAYDLFNVKINEIIEEVKTEIDADVILSSDDPSLFKADKFLRQSGSSFGEKFNNTIDESLQLGYDELVIIGNDSPELSSGYIINSFKKLESERIIIGPSLDGGIYLLGLTKNSINSEIRARWNTSHVKNDLLRFFTDKEVLLLDYLFDIDSENDLKNWFLTKSDTAELFQILLSDTSSLEQKIIKNSRDIITEQKIFRVHTQKAPPSLTVSA